MCGPPKRVWRLDPAEIHEVKGAGNAEKAYDDAVVEAACVYGKRVHNLFTDNCHHHVALVLNKLKYEGRTDWNQVRVFRAVWLRGRWVKRSHGATVFGPCLVLLLSFIGVMVFVGVQGSR